MPKLYVALLSSVVAFGIAGCKKEDIKQAVAPAPSCVWPDTPTVAAPGWICDEPVEGLTVSAVGSHEKTAAGAQFAKDQAAASARVVLAQQMKTHVQNMIKQYVETTGAGASETVDKVNTSVSKLITAQTIEGSRIFKSMTSPSGSTYVLVGMDPALVEKKVKDVVKTSMNNERALWQQFKAKQGQDELAGEIAKYAGGHQQPAGQ